MAIATLFSVSLSSQADATVIINIKEVGPDVVATLSGSVDLDDLTRSALIIPGLSPGLQVGAAAFLTGSTSDNVIGYTGLFGPISYGVRNFTFRPATSTTGDIFGINGSSFTSSSSSSHFELTPFVFLSQDYVSGTELSATDTFANQTLASLGLTVGKYVFKSTDNRITLNIGTATPEPGSWILMIAGVTVTGLAMRRTRPSPSRNFRQSSVRVPFKETVSSLR